MQDHVKAMTEVFDELSVVGDPIKEEDRVVHLLASLPRSFDMLVTALEANAEVPKMEIVTERLLFEEQKVKEREELGARPKVKEENAYVFANKFPKNKAKGPKCHNCGKIGHIKKFCRDFLRKNDVRPILNVNSNNAHANNVNLNTDNESVGLLVTHALKAGTVHNLQNSWIIDSGATAHMCNNRNCFNIFDIKHGSVALGDGRILPYLGTGKVPMKMNLPDGTVKNCILSDVLFVPDLSFNLLSVPRAAKSGKCTEFLANK